MTSGQYAKTTQVSVEKTRSELEHLLQRAGADNVGYMMRGESFTWLFTLNDRNILIKVPLPNRSDQDFTHTPQTHVERSESSAQAAYEQAVRQLHRQTLLWIRAKLEAVAVGITTIEDEFLPQTVVGNTGVTVGTWLRDQVNELGPGKPMPPMPALPALPAPL